MSEAKNQAKNTVMGMRPWLKGLLFISLAVNLAVAGGIIGVMVKYGPHGNHHPPRLETMAGPFTHALSHHDRRLIGAQMRQAYQGAHPTRQQIRVHFESVLQALRAKPYDPSELVTLFGQHRAVLQERQDLGQRLLLQRLERMSNAERAAFADRLEAGLRHRGPH